MAPGVVPLSRRGRSGHAQSPNAVRLSVTLPSPPGSVIPAPLPSYRHAPRTTPAVMSVMRRRLRTPPGPDDRGDMQRVIPVKADTLVPGR